MRSHSWSAIGLCRRFDLYVDIAVASAAKYIRAEEEEHSHHDHQRTDYQRQATIIVHDHSPYRSFESANEWPQVRFRLGGFRFGISEY